LSVSAPPVPLDPAPGAGRVLALDALRGLAVIGIAWMNIHAYAMPAPAYYNPRAWGGDGPVEMAIWFASFVLVEDKFRTLFALLFGAGVAIQLNSDRGPDSGAHFRRMLALLAIGIAHTVLISDNDILRIYALAGLVLPAFLHLTNRQLLAWAAGLVAAGMLIDALSLGTWLPALADPGSETSAWETLRLSGEQQYGVEPDRIAYLLEEGRQSFAARTGAWFYALPWTILAALAAVPLNLGTMLLGVACWNSGLLAGRWSRANLLRMAVPLAAVSIPVLVALALWALSEGLPGLLVGVNALVLSQPLDIMLALAYAALAMGAFSRGGLVVRLLGAAGRLSLTNYLLTSVVFAVLVRSWGLGLFGRLDRGDALALTLVPTVMMLVASPLWLRLFRQGPMEWLWRGAATGRFPPLRRRRGG